jgi:hypothetical protein
MFEHYTDKARRTIFFARVEAGKFGAEFVEPQHFLSADLRSAAHREHDRRPRRCRDPQKRNRKQSAQSRTNRRFSGDSTEQIEQRRARLRQRRR